jgi:hypothetical protein
MSRQDHLNIETDVVIVVDVVAAASQPERLSLERQSR